MKNIDFRLVKNVAILIFFSFISFLYFHNLTRDIYSGDIGDLVTASYVGGVAHPPGYPLFVILGHLFSLVPFKIAPVTKVTLVSTLSSLLGLLIFYKFSYKVTKSVFVAILATAIIGLSYFYWLHAEIPEVFGLNNFLAIAILSLAILFYVKKKERYLYLLSFVVGLSLTHQQTILLIMPSVGLLIIGKIKILWQNKRVLIKALLCILAGLAFYIYVPVAASSNPLVNWDNAVNLKNFLTLILRKDYGGFAPSVVNGIPFIVKSILARDFLKTLVSLYSYQIIVVAFLGMFYLFRKDKLLLLALATAFIISGPVFIFYSATFITTTIAWGVNERFYILPAVIFGFFLPFGFMIIRDFLNRFFSRPLYSYIILAYFFIVPYFMLVANFPRTDLSKTEIGNNLAKDFLSALPQRAVLFVTGDTTTFNIWYSHYVLGERRDIDIINPPGVGNNIFLDNEINRFHEQNTKVDLKDIVTLTLNDLALKRPLYATYEVFSRPKESVLLPYGLVYQIVNKENIPDKQAYIERVENMLRKLHIKRSESLALSEQNLVTGEIPLIYSNALVRVGDFILSYYNDPSLSEHYYRRALWIDPDNPSGYAGLGLSLFKANGDCDTGIKNLETALNLYPIWQRYYMQLYLLYTRCNKNDELARLKEVYKGKFNEDIKELLKREKVL